MFTSSHHIKNMLQLFLFSIWSHHHFLIFFFCCLSKIKILINTNWENNKKGLTCFYALQSNRQSNTTYYYFLFFVIWTLVIANCLRATIIHVQSLFSSCLQKRKKNIIIFKLLIAFLILQFYHSFQIWFYLIWSFVFVWMVLVCFVYTIA